MYKTNISFVTKVFSKPICTTYATSLNCKNVNFFLFRNAESKLFPPPKKKINVVLAIAAIRFKDFHLVLQVSVKIARKVRSPTTVFLLCQALTVCRW